jgi:hypothetical protein
VDGRCRNHKAENVMGHLPELLKDHVKTVLKAAYRLPAEEGMARLKQQCKRLHKAAVNPASSGRPCCCRPGKAAAWVPSVEAPVGKCGQWRPETAATAPAGSVLHS